ncbi:MAG: TetR/AcrR family transcriptional regulator [Firmicutes bacterium]|nr:TetR/AcrR family transcriptional regulator [Bacillota bacterium]
MARISAEEKEKIKSKILDVSREFFYDIGYDNTSTRMIAKKVGVAEGTIFNYFDSKSEIFFEVFYQDSQIENQKGLSLQYDQEDVSKVICEHILEVTDKLLILPKKILYEMMIASIKIAKSKPEFFRKMASLDFQYMQEIADYLEMLIQKKVITNVDTKQTSEIIYGIIMFQFVMYFYEKERSKDKLKEEIINQVGILLKGYLIGGNSNGN